MIANVLTALIALVASAGGSPPLEPTADASVRVLSSNAEVRFPDEVVFRLTTESQEEITNLKLHYRFVNLSTTSYAYPEFRQSSRVDASYRLQTGGSSYVPAGATIEYYYEFTDANGRRSRTESAVVEYLDPRFDWRTVRTENLLVVYHDRAERDVLAAARVVDRHLADLKDLLGMTSARPVKAVILSSRSEARRTFPFVSQTAHDSHLFGGFAYGEYGLFLLGGLDPDGMTHEAVHVLVHEALESPYLKMPAWLNEGLAMYFEPRERHSVSLVSRAVRSGDAPPLRYMYSIPGQPGAVRLFYAHARNVVTYMIDELGRERMTALLRELKRGSEIDEAVRAAYGMGLDELDERWRAWLTGGRSQADALDYTSRTSDGLESDGDSQSGALEAYGASDILALASNASNAGTGDSVRSEPGAAADTALSSEDASGPGPGTASRATDEAKGLPWLPIGAGAAALLAAAVTAAAVKLGRD